MSDYNLNCIKFISHEIKNQLSICDLYAEIIKKTCVKNEIFDINIMRAIDCIKNSIKMSGNSLLELKSCDTTILDKECIKLVLEEALNLSKVYGIQKNINITSEIKTSTHVLIDKTKFIATIINLIKNACEAFKDEPKKNIFVNAVQEKNVIKISVSNNAEPINNPDKIFTEGYTTKSTGNGLGLAICKSNIEKMNGKLKLLTSDLTSTVFEITLESA